MRGSTSFHNHLILTGKKKDKEDFAWPIFATLPLSACLIRHDGFIEQVNIAWLRLAEKGPSVLAQVSPGANFLDICRKAAETGEGSARDILYGIESVARGEEREFSIEYTCQSEDKKYWFLMKAAPVEGIGLVLIVLIDVTERKLAEHAFRESSEKYRVLYEDNPTMYFTVARNGKVLSVNRFGAMELGYSPEELVGQPVLSVFHPEDKEAVRKQLEHCLENTDRVVTWEFRKVRKDGGVLWVKEAARALRQANGQDIILIVCEDITERKLAHEALRESEQRMNLAIQQAGMGTWDIDLRTGKVYWSENKFRLLGYQPHPAGEATLDMWKSRIHPDDSERLMQEVENARRGRGLFASEYRITPVGTGEVVWLSAFGRFLYDEKGEPIRFAGIFFDSTGRKEMEEEVRKTHHELEMRVRELNDKTQDLEEVNTALRVIFKHREQDRREVEESINLNVRSLISPYLEKLKKSRLSSTQMTLVEILESHLTEITSPFSRTLGLQNAYLTPTEMQVAVFVKDGKTTDEIAEILSLSEKTIETHRSNIRKKLGITGKRKNLRSQLLGLSGSSQHS